MSSDFQFFDDILGRDEDRPAPPPEPAKKDDWPAAPDPERRPERQKAAAKPVPTSFEANRFALSNWSDETLKRGREERGVQAPARRAQWRVQRESSDAPARTQESSAAAPVATHRSEPEAIDLAALEDRPAKAAPPRSARSDDAQRRAFEKSKSWSKTIETIKSI
ncbi:hypothetical protein [Roseivivax sp. CAU 1761]